MSKVSDIDKLFKITNKVCYFGKPSKKKKQKSLEFSKWVGGLSKIQFLGFFLKPMGKHWKWSDSSRNAKKKISLLWVGGGVVPCTVQYCTVQNSTVEQQNLV